MDITIKMIAPKVEGCGHIKVEYVCDGKTLTKVYHRDELKELALEDVEPVLRQIVAKTILDGLAADAKATLTSVCCEKQVTI